MKTSHSIIAVGAGPSNLSFAALAEPLGALDVTVLERASAVRWHSGMQVDDAELQVSYLKDLVTLVDPTSRFSFLSFLKFEKRIYRSLVANRDYTSRLEFERYLQWVAASLPKLKTGVDVQGLTCDTAGFKVHANTGVYGADHLVVGVGRTPKSPGVPGADLVGTHSAQFMQTAAAKAYAGKRIAVIGGGQSGAEIVSHLLQTYSDKIEIIWVCKRPNLLLLDDTPFINEQFFPNYLDFLSVLEPHQREKVVTEFRCTSDGISDRTLSQIYRQLYDLECVKQKTGTVEVDIATSLQRVLKKDGRIELELRNELLAQTSVKTCDDIIYATGYEFTVPDFLREYLNGEVLLAKDHSVINSGSKNNRIFVQNASVSQFGLAEPNLSLLAWRAAGIVNAIAGDMHYDLEEVPGALKWPGSLENTNSEDRKVCLNNHQRQYS